MTSSLHEYFIESNMKRFKNETIDFSLRYSRWSMWVLFVGFSCSTTSAEWMYTTRHVFHYPIYDKDHTENWLALDLSYGCPPLAKLYYNTTVSGTTWKSLILLYCTREPIKPHVWPIFVIKEKLLGYCFLDDVQWLARRKKKWILWNVQMIIIKNTKSICTCSVLQQTISSGWEVAVDSSRLWMATKVSIK